MLKLPGRGKEGLDKSDSFNPYKSLFSVVNTRKEERVETKKFLAAEKEFEKKKPGEVVLQNVGKRFGKQVVLDNVNLKIKPGTIFGIIGPSGSGKTTILRLIIGFYKPTTGTISFNQQEVRKHIHLVDTSFGFATQDNSFYHELTVEENVRFFGKLYGLHDDFLDANISNTLGLVDLSEARHVEAKNLSGGMQRRLDLACALIHDPKVLILDEPTEDLDPLLRNELLGLIKNVNKSGTTIIFTTHLLEEAEFLCDEVAVLADGKVISVGSIEELRKAYRSGDEIHLVLESRDYKRYAQSLQNLEMEVKENKLVIYVPAREKAIQVLKRVLSLVERYKDNILLADIRKPSLEDVFEKITKNVKDKKTKKGN